MTAFSAIIAAAMRTHLLALIIFISFSSSALAQAIPMPLLHATRGIHAGIYDDSSRYILLRGANYNPLGEYWQGNPSAVATKDYSDDDFRLMAQQGFNCVRLLYTWSRVEPQRGVYDTVYISRIRHAVEAASHYGLYVLLDMHQDAWGMYIATPDSEHCSSPARGWDGAPHWATITDGQPTCTRGSRETAPAVTRAFHHFWENTDSLQNHCIHAWCLIAAATAQYTNVLGYDLINEPNLGERSIYRSDHLAGRYYNKLIHALRQTEREQHTSQHIIFFEPSIAARGKEIPSVPYTTFRPETNIVFSPHHYFGSIAPLSIRQGFGLLRLVNFFYHTDMLIGEWGFFGGIADTSKVKEFTRLEDKHMLSSTWWQWAQGCGDPHSVYWQHDHWQAPDTSMHLIQLDRRGHFTGRINDPYLKILSRPRPLAIPGTHRHFTSDPVTGQMTVKGRSKKQNVLILWVSQRFDPSAISGTHCTVMKTDTLSGGYKVNIAVQKKYSVQLNK